MARSRVFMLEDPFRTAPYYESDPSGRLREARMQSAQAFCREHNVQENRLNWAGYDADLYAAGFIEVFGQRAAVEIVLSSTTCSVYLFLADDQKMRMGNTVKLREVYVDPMLVLDSLKLTSTDPDLIRQARERSRKAAEDVFYVEFDQLRKEATYA